MEIERFGSNTTEATKNGKPAEQVAAPVVDEDFAERSIRITPSNAPIQAPEFAGDQRGEIDFDRNSGQYDHGSGLPKRPQPRKSAPQHTTGAKSVNLEGVKKTGSTFVGALKTAFGRVGESLEGERETDVSIQHPKPPVKAELVAWHQEEPPRSAQEIAVEGTMNLFYEHALLASDGTIHEENIIVKSLIREISRTADITAQKSDLSLLSKEDRRAASTSPIAQRRVMNEVAAQHSIEAHIRQQSYQETLDRVSELFELNAGNFNTDRVKRPDGTRQPIVHLPDEEVLKIEAVRPKTRTVTELVKPSLEGQIVPLSSTALFTDNINGGEVIVNLQNQSIAVNPDSENKSSIGALSLTPRGAAAAVKMALELRDEAMELYESADPVKIKRAQEIKALVLNGQTITHQNALFQKAAGVDTYFNADQKALGE